MGIKDRLGTFALEKLAGLSLQKITGAFIVHPLLHHSPM